MEKAIKKIIIDEETGCWIWTGAKYGGGRNNYGATRM